MRNIYTINIIYYLYSFINFIKSILLFTSLKNKYYFNTTYYTKIEKIYLLIITYKTIIL